MNITTALPAIPVTSAPPMESMQTDNAAKALVSEPTATEKQNNSADSAAPTYSPNGKVAKKGKETADGEKGAEAKGSESEETKDEKKADATEEKKPNGQQLDEQELEKVDELKSRDQEVRVHEQAHAAVGGQYAGSPSYEYERGPDGKSYAVGGEVQIDVSPVQGDPQATIQKMQVVRRAALAPAQPSAADRSIAADAANKATQARAELAKQQVQGEEGEQKPDISINAPFKKSLEGEGASSGGDSSDSAAPAEQGKKTLSAPERGAMIASFYDNKVRPSVDSFSATA
ncbi:putative metalloprotease CJM1_0395 family protein [Idiomarina sp.]|uniref:putative metalloprotease CJM1_0395 family protein n=1 Tax=Idiomarina sp. TaxID=1874361 RepID=UPI00262932A6|nr:putative metalloprotease CJM1_0395 family protein [Idiomarina sp.]